MKIPLPLVFFVLAACACIPTANAQSASYDRPTVNFLLLKHGDAYDASSAKVLSRISPQDKFYTNKFGVSDVLLPQMNRSNNSTTAWQPILAELVRHNIAKKEIQAWYVRQPNGLMSMSLIHSRGEFNATDDDYNLATTTKRGTEELQDFGRKLIAKTFVVVLDYSSIAYSANSSTDIHSWSSTVRAFVFKLKYNDEVEEQIYNAWIDEGDSAQVVEDKIKRFNQIPFEMEFLTQVKTSVSVSSLITGKTVSGENGLASVMRMAMSVTSKDAMLDQMYMKGYTSVMNELEKQVAHFKVQAGVSGLSPIRAKIGAKEGLKTDQRYFVNEYVADDKGQIKAKRKAVVRVGRGVVDNRKVATGKSAESKFYQIAGGGVEEGMTLEQKNDAGISLMAGYGPGLQSKEGQPSQSGAKLRVELLINKVVNFGIPSLYLYAEGEGESTHYDYVYSPASAEGETGDYMFWRAGFGLGKGFYFWRNFSLSPYLGMGFEYAATEEYPLETMYFKAGINAAINIYYPLQLVGGVSAFAYGAPSVRKSYEGDEVSFGKYSDVFRGRSSGGFAGFIGVRINF